MPLVAKEVEKYFGKRPSRAANPDEAVAQGAAIQGGREQMKLWLEWLFREVGS